MVNICFYFQVHQPYRIKNYTVFDIGNDNKYFNDKSSSKINNKQILNKVAKKCYFPANKIILKLLKDHPEFKVSYSFSGTILEQMEEYNPDILTSFQELHDTKKVEILSETSHHSLSFMYSLKEFQEQINLHKKKIKQIFNTTPQIFRNTELIYNNVLAKFIENLGYKGILAEGWDYYLKGKSPNFIYHPKHCKKIKLLLKNYKLSDDIAFRFSNQGWEEWPLSSEKFAHWISEVNGSGDCVNLFMDYETLGEHQWESTGIFNFLQELPNQLLKHPDNSFVTPTELTKLEARDEIDVPYLMSWADLERDTSAWQGNSMQQSTLQKIYELENKIKSTQNQELIENWRKLQTSDHFYYMCTKWFSDGDVHKYFNPYDSPYEAYINYTNVLNDLKLRLKKLQKEKII